MDLTENKAVAWIELALNMLKWHTFVYMVMNLWDPQEFRISRPAIILHMIRRILYCGLIWTLAKFVTKWTNHENLQAEEPLCCLPNSLLWWSFSAFQCSMLSEVQLPNHLHVSLTHDRFLCTLRLSNWLQYLCGKNLMWSCVYSMCF